MEASKEGFQPNQKNLGYMSLQPFIYTGKGGFAALEQGNHLDAEGQGQLQNTSAGVKSSVDEGAPGSRAAIARGNRNSMLPSNMYVEDQEPVFKMDSIASPALPQKKKTWNPFSSGGGEWTPFFIGGLVFLLLAGGGVAAAIILTKQKASAGSVSNSPSTTTDATGNTVNLNGLPKDVGNCLSGKFPFAMSRVTQTGYDIKTIDPSVNVNTYDFILPYGKPNVQMSGGKMTMSLTKSPTNNTAAQGALLTTSRYMWYGKYSVTIQAINKGGAITDVITMSDQGDEIDIEICGKPVAPYTNVFWNTSGKAAEQHEYFGHYAIIDGFDMSIPHTYTIDWKHDSLTWLVDGTTVRTLLKSNSTSLRSPNGPKWFPTTPSLIQFGVWDASFSADPRTVAWAGGPLDWGRNESSYTATYSDFNVQCYDAMDQPVGSWP